MRPEIRFPEELPISARRAEIQEALAENQVIVVCGETGSGKTTQLPKMCLDAGRGRKKLIGHTQPRRIAARSVAERIAAELDSRIGEHVGYKMRFSNTMTQRCSIQVMTDGILLAEIRSDPELRRYDTIILDEAHERSLNIDFLLGYLKRLLPRRPQLRLIITSATINTEKFSDHFGQAPIVEVSGRNFPVELRYRPLDSRDAGDRDLQSGILQAAKELWSGEGGDILVFLSGEREIHDTATFLGRHLKIDCEILQLYGRLSTADQQKIFQRHQKRRLVLATNIAETSLTVPGIRFVIDSGLARIRRYSPRTKVQRLPIEKISRASARQRSGRCGRLAPGVCIRLYDEEDFEEREEFTPAEVLRTNLASVILQLKIMDLGDVANFPFLDPPAKSATQDGLQLLRELGALDHGLEPTAVGQALARLPVDPRIGRMMLGARDEGCLEQVLVIAAALSIQDPRERPAAHTEAADRSHEAFSNERSDFVSYLILWNAFDEHYRGLSRRELREYCSDHFLSFARMWEWRDVHRQLRILMSELSSDGRESGNRRTQGKGRRATGKTSRVRFDDDSYRPLHRALLTGLLSNVANLDGKGPEYRGTNGKTVFLFPGSSLFRKRPKWIMASVLMETTRLYARICARIEPEWIVDVAGDLVQCSYRDPFWDERSGRVLALESISLRGLVLHPGRKKPYDRVDPETCRRIFLENGLVSGLLETSGTFLAANSKLLDNIAALEDKSRRRDIAVGPGRLLHFYDERVPTEVTDRRSFERWRLIAEETDPSILHMTRAVLMQRSADDLTQDRFPDRWLEGDLDLSLSYRFEPGHEEDGLSVQVPVAALDQLQSHSFEWLVPGYLEEKVVALLRSLPKTLRKMHMPLAQTAAAFLDHRGNRRPSLKASLQEFLERRSGARLPADVFDETRLPAPLLANFQIVGPDGAIQIQGRDLETIRKEIGAEARRHLDTMPAPKGFERQGIRAWDFGELPDAVLTHLRGMKIERYPALVDRKDSVDLVLFENRTGAGEATRRAIARLILLALPQQAAVASKALAKPLERLRWNELPVDPWPAPEGSTIESFDDEVTLQGACDLLGDSLPHDPESFYELLNRERGRLVEQIDASGERLLKLLDHQASLRELLQSAPSSTTVEDVEDQLSHLLYRGSLIGTPDAYAARLPHYFRAIETRLRKAVENPERELERSAQYAPHWHRFKEAAAEQSAAEFASEPWIRLRFQLEELRISIFAQEIKTAGPVSVKRIEKLWLEVLGVAPS